MISKQLLELLACPVCKIRVELTADGQGLKCSNCHRVYPICDDIPVMRVDEALVQNT
ncbi:MAG: Trm112 family protein [Blastocatellia bacterium]|nr:Trm112 family protein [Blastocatellia bacterium]